MLIIKLNITRSLAMLGLVKLIQEYQGEIAIGISISFLIAAFGADWLFSNQFMDGRDN